MSARERMRTVRRELEGLSLDVLSLRESFEAGSIGLEEYVERRFELEVSHTARAISSLRTAFRME